MLCSADCSNTSCSITEVLDLSPSPLRLMTGCVWEDKKRTYSVCVHTCVCGIPGDEEVPEGMNMLPMTWP